MHHFGQSLCVSREHAVMLFRENRYTILKIMPPGLRSPKPKKKIEHGVTKKFK